MATDSNDTAENEIKNLKNEEKTNNMEEKVLYEIRYVETEDGFRIEATGDKKGLRKMGFGPRSMMGFGRYAQHGRGRGARRMRRMRARRAAMAAEWGHRGPRGHRGPWGEAGPRRFWAEDAPRGPWSEGGPRGPWNEGGPRHGRRRHGGWGRHGSQNQTL